MKQILCFGEVLWDLLPSGKVLGGAPFNVALRLHECQQKVVFCTAIGNDKLGDELLDFVEKSKVAQFVTRHAHLPTGVVQVELKPDGSAAYTIEEPAAWDAIEGPTHWEGALVFGSLALRQAHNRETIDRLLETATEVYFDVNLRAPFYDFERIKTYVQRASLVKFNEEEFSWFSQENWGISNEEEALDAFELAYPGIELCVTKGAEGALYMRAGKRVVASAPKVTVSDTIGAGDAFFAALIAGIRQQHGLQQSLENACAIGAHVASQKGASTALPEYLTLQFGD